MGIAYMTGRLFGLAIQRRLKRLFFRQTLVVRLCIPVLG